MPTAPPSPCAHPGCHRLSHQPRCPEHTTVHSRQRGSSAARGYGAHWRKTRALHLQQEPWCRECAKRDVTTEATQVDHIIPRSRGGTDEASNLQALCASCHSRKTAQEGRAGVGQANSLSMPKRVDRIRASRARVRN